jgi:hypothetical protein
VPGAVLREPASFIALLRRRRPRNVKLALCARCKARPQRHGPPAGMVRYAQRAGGPLSPSSIASWAQNCERADGASGEHLQQGCHRERPLAGLAGLDSRGDRCAMLAVDVRRPNVGKPPQATSAGSVSGPHVCAFLPMLHHYVLSSTGLHACRASLAPYRTILLPCR